MFEKTLILKNKSGIHARPATGLVTLCQTIESDIRIITDKVTVNPKSIISILKGELIQGKSFILQVEGTDEEKAGEKIVHYINTLEE